MFFRFLRAIPRKKSQIYESGTEPGDAPDRENGLFFVVSTQFQGLSPWFRAAPARLVILGVRLTSTRMLKAEDIRIETGRAVGGDFMRITHVPTGISRSKSPPLGAGRAVHEFRRQSLREIEAELQEKGLTQYLLPDPPVSKRNHMDSTDF